ncbi:prepilin-type N-terminal cleavage/methylation domain-containing protein [Trichocoleus sp. FACHB-40]|nr:prepilin-type N-terminal cleavage/methylation domain-containing protein [Trichocoleus sp. FACHB-40]
MRQSHLSRKISGFTLIEVLVAMIIAALVLTPLLGFMVNILDTDRKEQAKASTEQEIQAALDFIAQDMEQAFYVYEPGALTKSTSTTDAAASGIANQIPGPGLTFAGCADGGANICKPIVVFWKRDYRKEAVKVLGNTKQDDTFVYSLVGYYLIKGNDSNNTWSKAARIARFQIRDGVPDTSTANANDYAPNESPSAGFKPFDRKKSFTQWEKSGDPYNVQMQVLVDYIDADPTKGFTLNKPAVDNPNTPEKENAIAEIIIRGNARERINLGGTCAAQDTYCPYARVQIKERAVLGE